MAPTTRRPPRELDYTGVSQQLQLDDHETTLICTWVRTGFWLYPAAEKRLDVVVLELEDLGSSSRAALEQLRAEAATDFVIAQLRLKGGRVTATVAVDTSTWKPLALIVPVCGDIELTSYHAWSELVPGVPFARKLVTDASDGGRNVYTAQGGRAWDPTAGALTQFRMPPAPLCPPDTFYTEYQPVPVPFWHSRSQHILVKPEINGVPIDGLMILDTGASGYVITREFADEMELEGFGELYVSGVTQKVKSQFRRTASISIGGMTQENPLFMELPLDGVVNGAPERIVGILGHDIFRRAVVEILPLANQRPNVQLELILHHPEKFRPPQKCNWMDLQLVSNVPHVEAEFSSASGREFKALFMLDSGAGGAGVMFHSRSQDELDLVSEFCTGTNTINVRGVGGNAEGSKGELEARRGVIPALKLGPHDCTFKNVSTLIAVKGGLDLSLWTAGMICVDLLKGCTVIFDYPRGRVSLLTGRE